jgi:hypothetical protein
LLNIPVELPVRWIVIFEKHAAEIWPSGYSRGTTPWRISGGGGVSLRRTPWTAHGLIRRTREWLEFWREKIERLTAGEDVDPNGITLAVTDAIIQAAEQAEMDESFPIGGL